MTRQTRIPGTEPTVYPDVNRAAEQFLEARQGQKNATDTANRCKTDLITRMKKHGLTRYKDPLADDDGLVIELDEKDVVKVTKTKKPRGRRRRGS